MSMSMSMESDLWIWPIWNPTFTADKVPCPAGEKPVDDWDALHRLLREICGFHEEL